MTTGNPAQMAAIPQDAEERQRLLLENLPEVRYIARRIHDRLPAHVPFDEIGRAHV